MKILPLAALAIAGFAATPAFADQNNELYVGAGTTGATVGFGRALGPHTGLRVEGNFLDYARDVDTDSARYAGKLKIQALGAYYDVFFAGPFRLSAGVLAGTRQFTGDAQGLSGTVTINHQDYDATGEYLHARAKYATVSPYLGLGWGHRPSRGGLGFFGDVGVAYGSPDVSLTVSPGLQQAAGADNIAAEKASLQSKADDLTFYPVIRVGIDYQW